VSSATKKAFKHRIQLAPQEFLPKQKAVRRHASIKWKENALYVMRRRYYFQVLKANVKLIALFVLARLRLVNFFAVRLFMLRRFPCLQMP
jgi:hypothetical protein